MTNQNLVAVHMSCKYTGVCQKNEMKGNMVIQQTEIMKLETDRAESLCVC